ncbi:MAG: hypothetical protein OES26_27125, partial [Gammaproteobacteria bacterium]|nr:hypothetical protein [Gammaproteobacteria bacterium]
PVCKPAVPFLVVVFEIRCAIGPVLMARDRPGRGRSGAAIRRSTTAKRAGTRNIGTIPGGWWDPIRIECGALRNHNDDNA